MTAESTGAFTPGPWLVVDAPYGWDIMTDGRPLWIGSVHRSTADPMRPYPRRAEAGANAALIARAPDLLARAERAEARVKGREEAMEQADKVVDMMVLARRPHGYVFARTAELPAMVGADYPLTHHAPQWMACVGGQWVEPTMFAWKDAAGKLWAATPSDPGAGEARVKVLREALRLAMPILEDDLASFESDTPPARWKGFVRLQDLHCNIDRYRECKAIMAAMRRARKALEDTNDD